MTDEEISAIVSELLRARFSDVGFEGVSVKSEEDFDGAPILRVIAHFASPDVSSERLFDAFHDLRSALIGRGEERFVFLNVAYPHAQDEVLDEDVE
jgi:hypothetical protein